VNLAHTGQNENANAPWQSRSRARACSLADLRGPQAPDLRHPRRFHPVRDYLQALQWDGTECASALFTTYFGAEKTEYTNQIGSTRTKIIYRLINRRARDRST
jgi:hypothetical protein